MELNHLCMNCMQFTLEGDHCVSCHAVMPIAQTSANALPLGTVLNGRYLVGRVLGEGGFGITYLACDLQTQQRVAVKEYYPETLSQRIEGTTRVINKDQEVFTYGLQKFEDEAQTIHRMRYMENIVHIQSLFRENRTAYYIMEYLQGKDLRNLLKTKGGTLPFAEVVSLLRPLFICIQQIHNAGIIHRDISPDNIFVCDNGQIKLIDFGTAKVFLNNRNTMTKNIAVKQGFAALEQYLTNGGQGPWTDVYALACTIYRCITGRVPPYAINRTTEDPLIPPSQLCELTPEQERVLLRAMAVLGEDRYASIAAFAAELYATLPDITMPATPIFSHRILAALIDGALAELPMLLLVLVSPLTYAWCQLPWLIVFCALCAWLEHGIWHATLGKRWLKLRVVSAVDQETVSWPRLFCRNLLRFCLLPVQALFVFSGGKLAYHATLTKTDVLPVKVDTQTDDETQTVHPVEYLLAGVSGIYAGQQLPLSVDPIVFGRDGNRCSLVFPTGTPGISSVHCKLWVEGSRPLLLDMNSSYGTAVNGGLSLKGGTPQVLNKGDYFTLGTQRFTIL